MFRIVSILSVLMMCIHARAQQFVNVAGSQNLAHSYSGGLYGSGPSFHDFNRDGWDDLTLPDYSSENMFYINTNGEYTPIELLDSARTFKCLTWVDFDNDGDSDLSYTETDGLFGIYENIGDLEFEEIDLNYNPENANTDNFGITWGDYDRDGFLDFYVSRYIDPNLNEYYPNLFFKNNGDGSFTELSEELGITNGHQQTFIGSWFDSDLDGDLDLYLANDRNVYENALYINEVDSFLDVSAASGTNLSIFAMTTTIADYDNDEDLDIYCTNGFDGNHLLQNHGENNFEDLFPFSGAETYSFTWGAKWIDVENNGWKDLYVCSGSPVESYNRFFINDEDGTLSESTEYFDDFTADSHGAAKGDINNDGYYDLVVLNEAPSFSRLLENNVTQENGYVKVTLEGVQSNRDGIGTRLTAYIGDRIQTEFTFCGTDYLSQDSQHLIFGLGLEESIDSLRIIWPLGLEEWIYNIPASSELDLKQGENISVFNEFTDFQLCYGDSALIIIPPADSQTISWNHGPTGNSIYISEPGVYSCEFVVNNYFVITSDSFYVNVYDPPYMLFDEQINVLCNGENTGYYSISVQMQEDSVLVQEVDNLEAGLYFIQFSNEYGCELAHVFEITEPSELHSVIATTGVECFGDSTGTISFQSFGGIAPYQEFVLESQENIDLAAGMYTAVVQDSNGCLFSEDVLVWTNPSPSIDIEVIHASNSDLGSIIVVSDDISNPIITLNGTTASEFNTELEPGQYLITVEDDNGCIFEFSETVLLADNLNEIFLNLSIYPKPFTDEIRIDNLVGKTKMTLTDELGKTIIEISIQESSAIIKTSFLSSGVYFLNFQNSHGATTTRKLLKL